MKWLLPGLRRGDARDRPLQVEWGRDGSLYVVDFGVIEFHPSGMNAHPNTGVIWRVVREEGDHP